MYKYKELVREIRSLKNPEKAKILSGFFKTGKGEYGEGDRFLGITSAEIKEVAGRYWRGSDHSVLQKLLDSEVHEERVLALRMLVRQFESAEKEKNDRENKRIFDFYLKNSKKINNWDLVDLSAPNIVGNHLLGKDRKILYVLARSNDLWEKRIAIVSTFSFIRKGEYTDTFRIAEILLADKHDLIHKACGWMLREVGKRIGEKIEEGFLKKYHRKMPRTMLRYAIERFAEDKRKWYLTIS